jgi:hypothetical protein
MSHDHAVACTCEPPRQTQRERLSSTSARPAHIEALIDHQIAVSVDTRIEHAAERAPFPHNAARSVSCGTACVSARGASQGLISGKFIIGKLRQQLHAQVREASGRVPMHWERAPAPSDVCRRQPPATKSAASKREVRSYAYPSSLNHLASPTRYSAPPMRSGDVCGHVTTVTAVGGAPLPRPPPLHRMQ